MDILNGVKSYLCKLVGSSGEAADISEGRLQTIGKLDTNNAAGDAFGRLRISDLATIFESKFLNGSGAKTWDTETNGTATGAKVDATSSYDMTVAANNDFVIRQTLQRFNYQSGKSQLVLMTGIIGKAASVSSAIGLAEGQHGAHGSPYSIYNGIYFETIDNVVYVTIANNGVFTRVPQSSWNQDKMDGTGKSGITLDFTKCQIYMIDYEWLGVGRVRFGFNIDGVTYYCHYVNNANSVSNVYTKTPNLPIRYELRSTGGAASMKQICAAVSSEGGTQRSGVQNVGTSNYLNIPTNGAFNTNPATHGLFSAVRHQESKPYSFVELISQSILTLGANEMKWSIALVPGTTTISDNGTPKTLDSLTFAALPDTTLEFFSFDITQDTVLDTAIQDYIISEGFIVSGIGSASASELAFPDNLRSLGEDINGSRWCFLFSVQSYGTNEGRASLTFNEVI
jgi:hypothetical protein